MKQRLVSVMGYAIIFASFLMTLSVFLPPVLDAGNIIDEWNIVKVPAVPELKPVTIDPKTTALLMLDFNRQTCNAERRPRCIASIPEVGKLLALARTKGAPVVYSLSPGAAVKDIAQALAPRADEPVVTSGPDKFLGTDLEKILKEKGVKTVIVVGTAAHGAVLYTASGAAFRGFSVVVPVDGMSAEDLYAEQYVAWNLVNAPRVANMTTLTKIDLIR
ncbi:MAG: Isochorismatase family protein YecD [Syntrophorhabdus sp. PtaU1.Bin058]|nr:MAG: Isochorismatase family protein YecD [Syntrophorhabdus sp. PtaU1.Bin058]